MASASHAEERATAGASHGYKRATPDDLILRSRASGVSKDGPRNERKTRISALATEIVRALHRSSPSSDEEGAGKTGWPQHPGLSRRKKLRKRKNLGYGGDHTGLPCAMVLRLIRDPLGEPSRLPSSQPTMRQASSATWRQSFGAPGPHGFSSSEAHREKEQ
jgi:hypothetical protein